MEKPFFAFWSLQLKNKLEHINLVYILRQLKNPLINTPLTDYEMHDGDGVSRERERSKKQKIEIQKRNNQNCSKKCENDL